MAVGLLAVGVRAVCGVVAGNDPELEGANTRGFSVAARTPPRRTSIARYILKLARLGGYLARAHDPPPGTMVIWRGLSRLSDIELGASIRGKIVGN